MAHSKSAAIDFELSRRELYRYVETCARLADRSHVQRKLVTIGARGPALVLSAEGRLGHIEVESRASAVHGQGQFLVSSVDLCSILREFTAATLTRTRVEATGLTITGNSRGGDVKISLPVEIGELHDGITGTDFRVLGNDDDGVVVDGKAFGVAVAAARANVCEPNLPYGVLRYLYLDTDDEDLPHLMITAGDPSSVTVAKVEVREIIGRGLTGQLVSPSVLADCRPMYSSAALRIVGGPEGGIRIETDDGLACWRLRLPIATDQGPADYPIGNFRKLIAKELKRCRPPVTVARRGLVAALSGAARVATQGTTIAHDQMVGVSLSRRHVTVGVPGRYLTRLPVVAGDVRAAVSFGLRTGIRRSPFEGLGAPTVDLSIANDDSGRPRAVVVASVDGTVSTLRMQGVRNQFAIRVVENDDAENDR